ncbi:MAG: glutathione peroxidase [Oceanospirillaceae bacterium]|nr:glutathione peroxidase [Oceanospirillaceae bacterium]
MDELYSAEFSINGKIQSLQQWRGQPILVINTATKCGFTPQFEGLEALHKKYAGQGLKVIGFPCNQFKNQEPETDENMAEVCLLNHGVSFDLTHKVDVKGDNIHAVFKALTEHAPGIMGSKAVKWNFTKFLISPDGSSIERFGSITKPAAIEPKIVAILDK